MYTTKKNIVILTNGSLPIPSILGGAVENLVTTILFKNEISFDFNLTVVSPIYNIEQQLKYKFKHCQFILVNTNTIIFTIAKIFRYFANRIPGINIESQFLYTAKKRLKVINDIDIIILENVPNYLNFFDKKKFDNILFLKNIKINFSLDEMGTGNGRIFNNFKFLISGLFFPFFSVFKVFQKF